MQTYIQPGKYIEYTVAGSAVVVDEVVVVNNLIGIAMTAGAVGDTISLLTEGVVSVAKPTTEAHALGEILYWDASASKATKTQGTGAKKVMGFCAKAALQADTTVHCKLCGFPALGAA